MRPKTVMARFRNTEQPKERGQAGGEMVVFATVLIFGMVLVAVNAWAAVDAKFMLTMATREAVRAYVEARPGEQDNAARSAARKVVASYHATPDRIREFTIQGDFGRCEPVTIEMSYTIPSLRLPFASTGIGSRTVWAAHSEIVDPFRSRVPGRVGGQCVR